MLTRRVIGVALILLVAGQARAQQQLAPPVREWMDCEQGRLSRAVDVSRLKSPTDNQQDPQYAPEKAAVFAVKSYWVDASKMQMFAGIGLPRDLARLFVRKGASGQRQVRLLVHPESEGLYREALQCAEPADSFAATATASSRTLLLWPQGQPGAAFLAKLSLDKVIGGARRTVSQGEVARSVGVNNTLQLAARRGELPASFTFIPEVLSMIPRGMEEGGMIVRAIPRELLDGRVRYVPLFSLYATPQGGRPLLADMIAQSGLSPRAFVQEKILRPFAQQWIELAVKRGIIPEPHAQNVLLEVGTDGKPTGRFVHRDFGGFNIDFDHRRAAGLALPKRMPTITTLEQDYKIGRYGSPADLVGRNVDTFFCGGFVYNLDQEMGGWASKGWIAADALRGGTFRSMFTDELDRQVRAQSAQLNRRIRLGGELSNLGRIVAPLRSAPRPPTFGQRAVQRLRDLFHRRSWAPAR
jgi:hypothetical protein